MTTESSLPADISGAVLTSNVEAISVARSLADIRSRVGAILLPQALPTGFGLVSSSLLVDRDVVLNYRKQDVDGPIAPVLTVKLIRQVNLKVKQGTAESIKVGALDGVLVTGGWSATPDGTLAWKPDGYLSIIVSRDGWNVIVSAAETKADEPYWTRDALIKIAESMGGA